MNNMSHFGAHLFCFWSTFHALYALLCRCFLNCWCYSIQNPQRSWCSLAALLWPDGVEQHLMRDKVPVAFCFILLQILSSLRCSFHWLYTPDPCDLNATKRAVLRELNLALCLSLLRAQQGQLNSNQHPNADLWIFAWAELFILTPLLNKYLDVTQQLVYL